MKRQLNFLSAKENRKTFFNRIKAIYPESDWRYGKIEQAYNDAKEAFRGIEREDGTRYFEHIRTVTIIVIDYLRIRDWRIICAALLHDIVEDRDDWTIDRVRLTYGDYVATIVDYLSKPSKKEYPDKVMRNQIYHGRFEFAPRAFWFIKLADRWHNILDLGHCSTEKQQRKVLETQRYYLPHAEKQFILYWEIRQAIDELP